MKHLEGIVDIVPITFTLSDSDGSEDETSCEENDWLNPYEVLLMRLFLS